jgi:hypothetical protein
MLAAPAYVRAQASVSTATRASTAAPGLVVARRASSSIRVDARLDEPTWTDAQPIELSYETYPGNNTAAPVRTECRLSFDADNLYLGCRAYDVGASSIRAVRASRDDVTEHDRVGITIDPFRDRRRGWEFGVNPLGVQYDAVYDAQADAADPAWNAIWTSAGRIVGDGYVIEAAIPFKSLRFPTGTDAGDWGLIVWRYRPRDSNAMLRNVPVDPAVRCHLCQAGVLTGLLAATPARNIELGPTLTSIRTDRRDTPGAPMRRGSMRPELGLDARWSITPDVTLNITGNPDFSQVEADAAQLEANSLFALAYPERRPFFLEGADLFASPNNVVFTRSIADPTAGAKLTAKDGRNAFAFLGARDRVTNLVLPGHDRAPRTTLDDESTTLALRLRRDVRRSSTVGLLATARESNNYYNRVIGADALLRPHPSVSLWTQALLTRTDYPDTLAARMRQPTRPCTGSLFGGHARYQTRTRYFDASAWRYSRGFRADAGFITQVAVVDADVSADRIFWGRPGSWLTRLSVGAGWYPTRHDTTPSYTNAWRFVRMSYDGRAGFQYSTYLRMRSETFRGVRYDFWTPWMMFRVQPWTGVTAGVDATFGGEIDYVGQRLARTVRLTPTATLRLTREAEARVRHSLLRLTSGDASLLQARISEVRFAYHPTARLFARVITQYETTDRAAIVAPAVSASRTRSLSSQLLFSYRLDAQTAALLGYGDTREAAEQVSGNEPDELSTTLKPMVRSFLVKLSYAWRP